MKRRVAGLAATAAFSVGLLVAVEAGAFEDRITFQEIEHDAPVTTQYESRGVRFGISPAGEEPPPYGVSVAPRENLAAELRGCFTERCTNRTGATFTDPTSRFGLSIASSDSTPDSVGVLGFNAAGETIASMSATAHPGAPVPMPELTAPAGQQFSGFAVRSSDGTGALRHIVIDDLVFDRPDPPPTTTTTEPPPPTTPEPPPPPPPAPAQISIAGPEVLRLGDPARFVASVEPSATRHEWDLDGDGAYERDTGSNPVAEKLFDAPARFRIGVRATLRDGRVLLATRDIVIQRPPLFAVGFFPANPKPGSQVDFGLATVSEKGTAFDFFAWRFPGLAPEKEVLSVRATRTRAAAPPSFAPQVITLDGAQPTLTPRLKRKLPKKGTVPYEVGALDSAGRVSTVYGMVGVGDGGPPGPTKPGIVDCNTTAFEGPCASFGAYGQPATKVKTVLHDATPGLEVCLPAPATADTVKNRALAEYTAKVNLGYPVEFSGGLAADQVTVGQQHAAGPRGGGAVARSSATERECREIPAEVVSWDLGDGTVLTGEKATKVVSHEYKVAKTYNVTITARVPYMTNPVAFVFGEAENGFFTARFTHEIEVVEPFCGTLKLNQIPVKAVLDNTTMDVGASGCFLPQDPTTGKSGASGPGTVYRPFPGYAVDLNTVKVKSSQGVPVIDPDKARISPPPGQSLTGVLRGRTVFTGAQLDVPAPAASTTKEVKGVVAPLPPYTGSAPPVNGLPVVRTQAFLSKDVGATGLAWLTLPEPLDGDPTFVFGGGPMANLSSTPEDDKNTDFEIDLSGTDLGFVKVEELIIKHRKIGGWLGGGRLTFPPPLGMTLDAPYLRPPAPGQATSIECQKSDDPDPAKRVDGPSGLSIDEDGNFEFGGAALVFEPALNLYFVELNCVSIAANADPFYIVGKLTMGIPAGSPAIILDGCVLYARLKAKTGLGFSACGSPSGFKAPQDITWVRGKVAINIYNQVKLGSAYIDIRSDSCAADDKQCKPYKRYGFGGEITLGDAHYDEDGDVRGQLGLIAKVDGVIYEKPFKWQVHGKGGGCVPVLPCVKIEAVASSKGVGGCALDSFALYYYFKTEVLDYSLTGCSLESLMIERPESRRAGLRATQGSPLGGRMNQDIALEGGMRRVAFGVTGVGAETPRVTVTGPGGTTIVDTGAPWQKESGYHIGRKGNATFIQIEKPKAGTWRVEAQPGTSAFKDIEVARPIAEPRVLAAVTGRGSKKTLRYRIDVAKSDKVTFVEEGETVARELGAGRDGRGALRFRTGAGSPGKRTITAVVERDGLPIRRIVVDRYRAKRPVLGKPGRLRVSRGKRGLAVSWSRARGARGYRLKASLRGGRRVVIETKRNRAIVTGVSATEPVRLSVVGLGAFTRESPPTARTLRAKRAKPVQLAL